MLHRVPAFVCGHGRGGHVLLMKDPLAQVDRFFDRVVMVGELSRSRDHLHVGDAVVSQHLFRDLSARQRDGPHRIFREALLEHSPHPSTHEHRAHGDEDIEKITAA